MIIEKHSERPSFLRSSHDEDKQGGQEGTGVGVTGEGRGKQEEKELEEEEERTLRDP